MHDDDDVHEGHITILKFMASGSGPKAELIWLYSEKVLNLGKCLSTSAAEILNCDNYFCV